MRNLGRACFAALVGLSACSGEDGATGTHSADAGMDDSQLRPDVRNDTGIERDADSIGDAALATVQVAHDREVRGAWIASVARINWPKSSEAKAQQEELRLLLDGARKAGLNAVFLQIRPEADALYRSELEPWSRFLTGTQGQDPGYEPLQFALDECRLRGLELHAWLNPYRAKASKQGTVAANHVSKTLPQAVVQYGDMLWLDPGHPEALQHTIRVIEDILTRYDIDGLHFDDYFYPYPQEGVTFNDAATFSTYGKGMEKAQWRRENVNRLVAAVHDSVERLRPDVRWGISPFGIYRPGQPEGVVGLDQYEVLYADPLEWMKKGWISYVAPQLYWPTTSTGQPYERLLGWWDAKAKETGTMLLTGNSAANAYSLDEYRSQVKAMRSFRSSATQGALWWSIGPVAQNDDGLATMLVSEFYQRPAATPVMDASDVQPPAVPRLLLEGGKVRVMSSDAGLRYWGVYAKGKQGFVLDRLVPVGTTSFSIDSGTWAVSAIDRKGRESLGALVERSGASSDAGGLDARSSQDAQADD